uniref:Protein CUP-SHAPED COTYLEDON 3 n=1 Tax=Aegilops tauschii TaxID=37682 RepID=R7W6T7_AEGTA
MEGLDVDDVFHHYRLCPTEVEAVTYYLPRLLSGETLHGADKLIHRVEISGCEPKDLAARYAPAPQAVSSGDRFFFTTCKSKRGSNLQSVRGAGAGTWSIQKTTEICHAGVKVGEVKNLSFKKKGKSTGWVMEEYRCLLPEATVSDGVKVFCKMHLAQHAPDAARQESEAYKLQQQQPEAVTPSTHAQKRPAPAAAADPHPPRPKKRMRGAGPVPAPVVLDYAQASCESTTTSSRSDVAQAPEISSQSDVLESTQSVPEAGSSIARSTSEEGVFEPLGPISDLPDGDEDGFDLEELMRMMEDDLIEVEPATGANTGVEMGQQEPLYLDALDQGVLEGMLQSDYPAFHDADKDKRYNTAPDLDAPSL